MGNDLENPDSCDTVRKMGNDLKKIQTVVTLFGNWEMIWKNPDSFDTVRKMGNYLEKSGQL